MSDGPSMGSSRPYMLRAMYQWIVDNACTPYLLVDASAPGVEVPVQAINDGKVVLNLAPEAVSAMDMGNQDIVFLTRFSGVSMRVRVPVDAALAIYAQETGQGMMFQPEENTDPSRAPVAAGPRAAAEPDAGKTDAVPDESVAKPDKPDKPGRGGPHLRIVK